MLRERKLRRGWRRRRGFPSGAEPPVAISRPHKLWFGLGGVAAVVLLGVILAWSSFASRSHRPARLSFTDDSMQAWDGEGYKLWAHEFPRPFELSLLPPFKSLERLRESWPPAAAGIAK